LLIKASATAAELVPIATVTVLMSLLLMAPGAGKKVSDSLADVRYDCVSPDVPG